MFYQFYQYFQRPNFVSLVFCLLLHVFFTIISIISLLLLFLGLLHFFWLLEMEIEITAFTALLFCFLWVLLANFCHTHHYCFHFRDRETEAQRACNSSRVRGLQWVEPEFRLRKQVSSACLWALETQGRERGIAPWLDWNAPFSHFLHASLWILCSSFFLPFSVSSLYDTGC